MNSDPTILRPALRYYGGKWNLAPWIIQHFPAHQFYCEPCGGAASVLLQKPRSDIETYNDLDGQVVNFFRMLRDRRDELIDKIRLTPWSRSEYYASLAPCPECDEVERARRFWCAISMSFNSGTHFRQQGVRFVSDNHQSTGEMNRPDLMKNLYLIADRLNEVQIENRDALWVIKQYDSPDTLFYADPPYVSDTRTDSKVYAHEWTNDDHIAAAEVLRACAGYVVISGYACPLYTELYEAHGWQRFDKLSTMNRGGARLESIWLSPRSVAALNRPRQSTLFDLISEEA